jgi:hypothetical protein
LLEAANRSGMGQEAQDALLQRFLSEEDPSIAQACLESLFSEHVEPIVREITRYKLRSNGSLAHRYEAQDEEDIGSEVVLQLLARLQDLRASHTPEARSPIENFRGYVASTTYNVYHRYVRMKYPLRWRLKNRIRYLLNHRRGFTIRKDEGQEFLCGLATDRSSDERKDARSEGLLPCLDDFVESMASGKSASQLSLEELVRSFLAWRGSPVVLDELVGIVAELQGTRDLQRVQSQGEEEEQGAGVSVCELLPDAAVDVAVAVEQRFSLELLWREICQLPQRQRLALLLNLRDAKGGDALILFTLTGIASLRRIAEVIEMPPEELKSLWNKLPLEDRAIATLLGATRQQVINLRKSARERLARRMAAS